MTVVAANQDPECKKTMALGESVVDVAQNVGGILQEVAELCHQGTEVDDNNEPASENAQPSASVTYTIEKWITPTISL